MDEEEFEDDLEVDDHHCNVVRCIVSTAMDNYKWKHACFFHIFFRCSKRSVWLVLDVGSTMNVVLKVAVATLNRKIE